jgi:hypothetical protein
MPQPANPDPKDVPKSATPKKRWIIPAILLLCYTAQCAWFVRTQSLTYDEPVHIAEGLNAWRQGRFEQYNDHPPLARLLCTLPLLSEKWQINLHQLDEGFYVSAISPDPESLAWRARSMNVLLGLSLALLLWSAARRMFSEAAANFVLALFAFSPSLIAHFSLVTTDGAATLFIFATAWQLVRWRHHPKWKQTILLGLTLGLLLLAKFSTGVMFVIALLWMLILCPTSLSINPAKWNWTKSAAALLLAIFIVWAGYFFHVSRLTVHDGALTATFPNWSAPIQKNVHGSFNYSVLIPAGEYLEGFRELVRHNRQGQPAFLLGQASLTGGWKSYYPVTILLKWPTIVLILSIAGLALALWKRQPADFWIMASFPAIYFLMSLFARFNLGERHVLPLYPFALMFAGVVWERLRHLRPGVTLLILLAALNAADALRYAPSYLSYLNIMVQPEKSFQLLTDSNLDWGQGLLALRKYQNDHPTEPIHLAYFGSLDPAIYGIKFVPLAENERATGTVIVSATNLSGQYLKDPAAYRWLLSSRPTQILDHSLYVFKVEGNR